MGPTIYREKTTAAMRTKSPMPMHSSIVVRLQTDLAQIVAILGQNIVFWRQLEKFRSKNRSKMEISTLRPNKLLKNHLQSLLMSSPWFVCRKVQKRRNTEWLKIMPPPVTFSGYQVYLITKYIRFYWSHG